MTAFWALLLQQSQCLHRWISCKLQDLCMLWGFHVFMVALYLLDSLQGQSWLHLALLYTYQDYLANIAHRLCKGNHSPQLSFSLYLILASWGKITEYSQRSNSSTTSPSKGHSESTDELPPSIIDSKILISIIPPDNKTVLLSYLLMELHQSWFKSLPEGRGFLFQKKKQNSMVHN